MKIKILSAVVLAFFITGCGSDINPPKVSNSNGSNFPIHPQIVKQRKIILRGLSGPYPQTIKDKKLGEGLLDFKYKQIKNYIISYAKSTGDQIKISFELKSSNKKAALIKKEIKQYFLQDPDNRFLVNFYGPPDVKVNIYLNKNDMAFFRVVFINRSKFSYAPVKDFQVKKSIDVLQKESFSNWSVVRIKTNRGYYVTYEIMKDPVLVNEYYPGKYTKEPMAVTGVSFNKADQYCFKKYHGSVASLYVFELAMRRGLIEPATKFYANKEIVAAFDPGNTADTILKMPGDVVSLKPDPCANKVGDAKYECYADKTDYSTYLIFNYDTYSYESANDNYTSQDMTFRCIRKE